MKKITFALLLLSIICYSQNQKIDREPFKLELVANADNNYSVNIPKSPYFIKEKVLQIYPGEELNIETEIKGDTIYSMRIVDKVTFPDKTIKLKFLQSVTNRKNTLMMLSVVNPFDRKLVYDAMIYTVGGQQWSPTSIIPIQPKLIGYETWPDVIATMALEKWRFIK
jgi:hypothetical protein